MIGRFPPRFFPLLFLLAITPYLWAQNTETRTVRLTWNRDVNTFRYEVIVEDTGSRSVLREFTNSSFISITLPLGNYRCRVIPYDFLDRPGEGSQWLSFEVRSAVTPQAPPADKGDIAIEYPEDITKAEAAKKSVEPPPARDPLPFSLYVGAAWMPLIPIYHEQTWFFGEDASFAAFQTHAGILYTGFDLLRVGLELAGSWYLFDPMTVSPQSDLSSQHALTFGFNLVARKQLPDMRMSLAFRLGSGMIMLPGSDESIPTGESIFFNIGLSYIFFVTEHLFLEAGFNHVHHLSEKPSGSFRPSLGAGWQF